jgi:GNAT superfamily N-acetyltransferase
MFAIRPMTPEDVPAADRAAWGALQYLIPDEFRPDETVRRGRGQARVAHLQQTDPGGAWVAVNGDGSVIGCSLALVREGVWGLSLLGVLPEHQGSGAGRALLHAALQHAQGARGAIILSSENPAAMRSYARAGFALHPCVSLAGIVARDALPSGLRSRPGDPDADRELLDAAARHVRGAAYADDIRTLVQTAGCALLVVEGGGFAAHREGSPALLCAFDEDAARDLLWACFAASAPGSSVHVDFIMARQDWAIDVGLQCDLALSPEGPVFTRGELGAMTPFLPSGAYLCPTATRSATRSRLRRHRRSPRRHRREPAARRRLRWMPTRWPGCRSAARSAAGS